MEFAPANDVAVLELRLGDERQGVGAELDGGVAAA
jgi:hypothetical protein